MSKVLKEVRKLRRYLAGDTIRAKPKSGSISGICNSNETSKTSTRGHRGK